MTLTRCALGEEPSNLRMANEMVAVLHSKPHGTKVSLPPWAKERR